MASTLQIDCLLNGFHVCATWQNEKADLARRAEVADVRCAGSHTHCVPEGLLFLRHDRYERVGELQRKHRHNVQDEQLLHQPRRTGDACNPQESFPRGYAALVELLLSRLKLAPLTDRARTAAEMNTVCS